MAKARAKPPDPWVSFGPAPFKAPTTARPGYATRLLFRDERRQSPPKFRLWKAVWVDPFPYVPGTVPEKMLFAQLMFRRIDFVFQALGFPPENPNASHFRPNLGEIRPDFEIPSVRAVIEVQGTYFHTQPKSEIHDLDKLAEYHAWGWYVYWMFDLDILRAPAQAVEQCPEASGYGPTLGQLIPKASSGTFKAPGATTADANAVAIANHNRARPKGPTLTARVNRGRRKGRVVTAAAKPVPLPGASAGTLTATDRNLVRLSQQALAPAKVAKPKVPDWFKAARRSKVKPR